MHKNVFFSERHASNQRQRNYFDKMLDRHVGTNKINVEGKSVL
jgi:hypothetical protein